MNIFKELKDYFGHKKASILEATHMPLSEVHCGTRFKSGASVDVEIIVSLLATDESTELDKEQIDWFNDLKVSDRLLYYPNDKSEIVLRVENHVKFRFYKNRKKVWEN